MKQRRLGKTDLMVSEISLGTWAIGGPYWTKGESTGWTGPLDEEDIIRAIKYAIDQGVNHFDTADVYGYGNSERLLGKALGNRRNDVTIATKVGWATTTAPHVYDPNNIKTQCEQSLRNLGTDHVDLYYFHHCDFGENDIYLDDALDTFTKLQESGKIRFVGLSGYSEEEFLTKTPKINPDVIQAWADIEHDEFIRSGSKVRELIIERDLGFVAMMPLGQGRLLGKYHADNPPSFDAGDNRDGNLALTRESLAELEPRLAALRSKFGSDIQDLARVALQFLLSNSVVSCVIPGFRSLSQVRTNLRAAEQPLTPADVEFILNTFPREEMAPHPWAE
jgi:myo-inositol catabolism protein IolS